MPLLAPVAAAAVLLPMLSLPVVKEPAGCALPDNVQVAPMYRSAVARLVRESPTLCRQVRRIAGAHGVLVAVRAAHAARPCGCCRASTRFVRQAGALRALVRLPVSVDFAELLAHELEQVIEQIEGTDLRRLARARDSGVFRLAGDRYETRRAQEAGRAAARELRAGAVTARR